MRTAPVVIVPLASKDAYLDRYAEPDKGWTDRSEDRWPVPYWHVDTGMASLLILQTAVDEGLGACFFGIPGDYVDDLRAAFGIPADHTPIGAITVGHRIDDTGVQGIARPAVSGGRMWSTAASGALRSAHDRARRDARGDAPCRPSSASRPSPTVTRRASTPRRSTDC